MRRRCANRVQRLTHCVSNGLWPVQRTAKLDRWIARSLIGVHGAHVAVRVVAVLRCAPVHRWRSDLALSPISQNVTRHGAVGSNAPPSICQKHEAATPLSTCPALWTVWYQTGARGDHAQNAAPAAARLVHVKSQRPLRTAGPRAPNSSKRARAMRTCRATNGTFLRARATTCTVRSTGTKSTSASRCGERCWQRARAETVQVTSCSRI